MELKIRNLRGAGSSVQKRGRSFHCFKRDTALKQTTAIVAARDKGMLEESSPRKKGFVIRARGLLRPRLRAMKQREDLDFCRANSWVPLG